LDEDVPVLGDVFQVISDQGPQDVGCAEIVAVVEQPVSVGDDGDGPQGRTVALRAT
jgi:hypothetical protein